MLTSVFSNGTLDLNGQTIGTYQLALSGAGQRGIGNLVNFSTQPASLAGTVGGTSQSYAVGGTGILTLSGTVQGTLTKNGFGTLTLSGSVDNSGLGVIVNSGTLILAKSSSGSPVVHAVGSGGLTINGGMVQLSGTGGDQILDSAAVTINAGGTLDLNGKSESFNSLTLDGLGAVGAVGASLINSLANTSKQDNTSTLTCGVVLTGLANVGGNGNLVLPGVISGGFLLTKTGNGTLILSGNNTNYGGINVSSGILQLANPSALGDTSAVTTVSTNGVLDLNGQTISAYTLDLNGTGIDDNGALINSNSNFAFLELGTVVSSGGSGYTVGGTGDIRLGANVGGTLTKTGNNTLYLGGAADDSGLGLVADSGTVLLNKASSSSVHAIGNGNLVVNGALVRLTGTGDDQILDTANVTVNSGTFDINSNNETVNNVTLTGGSITGTTGVLSTLDTSDLALQSGTISAILAGEGVINKTTSGTVTLSGANTFAGTTYLTAGTLTANGSLSDLIVTGTLDPGSSSIINAGALSFGNGGVFVADLSGTTAGVAQGGYDQLDASGYITLGNNLASLQGNLLYTPAKGDSFTIIHNTGTSPVTGTFLGYAEGATVVIDSQAFKITYKGGTTGRDVVLTALGTTAPTVTTPTSSFVTPTTAFLGGSVTSSGGPSVTKRGFVYAPSATNPDPVIGGTGVVEVDDSLALTGSFTDYVTGLNPGTAYSFVAFATSSVGTSYSPPATFTTLPIPTSASLVEVASAGKDAYTVFINGPWTATSNAPWLHTSASGNGNGVAPFTFDANTGATRTGTLTIAGTTVTVTQSSNQGVGGTGSTSNMMTFAGLDLIAAGGFQTQGGSVSASGPVTVERHGEKLAILNLSGGIAFNSTGTTGTFTTTGVVSAVIAGQNVSLLNSSTHTFTATDLLGSGAALASADTTGMTLVVSGEDFTPSSIEITGAIGAPAIVLGGTVNIQQFTDLSFTLPSNTYVQITKNGVGFGGDFSFMVPKLPLSFTKGGLTAALNSLTVAYSTAKQEFDLTGSGSIMVKGVLDQPVTIDLGSAATTTEPASSGIVITNGVLTTFDMAIVNKGSSGAQQANDDSSGDSGGNSFTIKGLTITPELLHVTYTKINRRQCPDARYVHYHRCRFRHVAGQGDARACLR